MDKFVCVRIIETNGMDLSLFQFDYEQTFSVFFMNADGTIYGRYGTRTSSSARDNTLEGLRNAMEGALELHKNYATQRKLLLAKTGPASKWKTPESNPQLKYFPGNACIHCHQLHEAEVRSLQASKQPVPDKLLWPYSMPDLLGFKLDPKERASVIAVAPGFSAEKAGLKTGDKIVRLDGQPILSIADVQWVLQQAREPGSIKAEVERDTGKVQITLGIPVGWRRGGDFSWRRYFVENLRARLLGTGPLERARSDELGGLGIAAGSMALRVKELASSQIENRNASGLQNLKPGDVIVEVDGQKNFLSEGDLLAYLAQKKVAGQPIVMSLLRSGKPLKAQLVMQ